MVGSSGVDREDEGGTGRVLSGLDPRRPRVLGGWRSGNVPVEGRVLITEGGLGPGWSYGRGGPSEGRRGL